MRQIIDRLDSNYYAIDVPFAQCSACGAFNNRSNKATEWELMSPERKVAIVALAAFWGFGYSGFAWIAIGGMAMRLDPSIGNEALSSWPAVLTIATSLLVGEGANALWLLHQIRKSKARLSDVQYKMQLAGLHMLPQSAKPWSPP